MLHKVYFYKLQEIKTSCEASPAYRNPLLGGPFQACGQEVNKTTKFYHLSCQMGPGFQAVSLVAKTPLIEYQDKCQRVSSPRDP